ncbi:MAG: 3'-5' exonuclease [Patescibacteria group bacterium]
MKLSEFNLAVSDLETTGLSETEHEIIEIATIIYNPRQDKVLEEWETKINPIHIETASPKALQLNGYVNNPGLYTNNLNSALIKFNSLVRGSMVLGMNVDFDLKFLYKNMADLNIKPSFDRHRKIELMSMAWFAVKDTDIPGMSLADLCNHFGISNVGAHSAMIDCRRTLELYKALMEYYRNKNDAII